MMIVLERNERYISWLQPNNKKTEDQIPALRIDGKYYMLSLRMMKCIWRHVRLHKGFVNLETGLYGSKKLKIPMLLYIEKIRTQRRFNVSLFIYFLKRFEILILKLHILKLLYAAHAYGTGLTKGAAEK